MPLVSKSNIEAFPEQVGRYELLVPIGTGGMATVYLARMSMLGGVHRDVALKLMHSHLRSDPDWATHLLDEARLAAQLRHPNVVQVVEVGEGAHGVFLALEYVPGDTLSGLLSAASRSGKVLPRAIAGRILLDALDGLHAAHEVVAPDGENLNLVHRDFSPQNVLVGTDGLARLADFGIAKARGGQATATGVLKGKVAYMAPEQALGEKRIDRRVDIWAAGVVAWELLAGRRLYRAKNDVRTLLKVLSTRPPRLSSIRNDIPPELDKAVAQALMLDAGARWGSASGFRVALTRGWHELGGVAEREEVATYVTNQTREILDGRMRQVEQVLTLRRQLAVVSQSALRSTEGGDSSSAGSDSWPTDDSRPEQQLEAATAIDQPVRRRSRSKATLVVVALSLVALAVVAISFASSKTPFPSDATSSNVASTKPGGTSSATLIVEADAPMARLRIGRRAVPVGAPSRRVEVDLSDSETLGALSVEATDEVGRTATAEARVGAGRVQIAFASAPAASASSAGKRRTTDAVIERRAPKTEPKPVRPVVPTGPPEEGLAPWPR